MCICSLKEATLSLSKESTKKLLIEEFWTPWILGDGVVGD